MPRFQPEPPFQHGTPPQTAVVLVNLGSPDSPTPEAVRRYLKEFLSDPRVVEIPTAVWWPILNGIILNTRPKHSAAKYATIWTPEGSPLKVHTERQAKLLQGLLGERGHRVTVTWAMRYGSPALPEVLDRLKADNHTRILLLPAYPQYSASTTATVLDQAGHWLAERRNQPEVRCQRSFADDPGYIAALAASVREHWQAHGKPAANDKTYRLVMSFHGVPRRSLDLGDPYHCECHKTARLLARALDLPEHQALTTFQSRFGKAEWLQPYTAPTLAALPKEGVARVDVLCPGFVADCLETLEEIAQEVKADFLNAGGQVFHYLPCLNERPDWIAALADLAEAQLAGWPTRTPRDDQGLAESVARARLLGAKA